MKVRASAIAMAEQTLGRVRGVASASEEMHRTSTEIAGQMDRSNEAVGEIQARMEAASRLSARLGEAASDMNGVVDAITAIADQINLLALNATIEAARAGAAGRGFAVVATEVKSLAAQARSATARIVGEIGAMQAVSREVGDALASTAAVVDTVQGFIAQTVAASEQQRATTGQVSADMQATAATVAGFASSLDTWSVGLEERRGDDRVRTLAPATLTFVPERGGSERSVACVLLNRSKTGAKLKVEGEGVPDTFTLHVAGEAPLPCRVVRRVGDELGVRFA
jgi:methyl-accepting chemotaxis protein